VQLQAQLEAGVKRLQFNVVQKLQKEVGMGKQIERHADDGDGSGNQQSNAVLPAELNHARDELGKLA